MSTEVTNLPTALDQLIRLKGRRDNIKFTPSKLATMIEVDRSLIQRILNGEVTNPRIETLMKIVNFFSNEGFPITIDQLMNWNQNIVDVQEQIVNPDFSQKLQLYDINHFDGMSIGSATVYLPICSPGHIAVVTDKDLEPIFNSGSIFVVDMLKTPNHDNLVMIKEHESNSLMLAKYIISGENRFFRPYMKESMYSLNNVNYKERVIGVVVHINVKTD